MYIKCNTTGVDNVPETKIFLKYFCATQFEQMFGWYPKIMSLTPAVSALLKAVCPTATQDVRANLENRAKAIETAMYGPLNPSEPNDEYWEEIASEWRTSPEEAKKQRCGNCAAFIQTSEMLECIQGGLAQGDSRQTAWDVTEAGELGYCEAFDFKCASARTCRAWIIGGPITDRNQGRLK